jgi:hypothetical protein
MYSIHVHALCAHSYLLQVLVLVGVDADDPVLNTPSAKQQLQQAVVAHSFTDVQLSFEWIVFPAGGSPATTSCNFTADADGTPSGIPRHTSSGHSNTAVTPNAAVAAAAPAPAPAPAGGGEAGRTPTRGRVCHLWSCMAEAAVWQHGCQLVVLLGECLGADLDCMYMVSPHCSHTTRGRYGVASLQPQEHCRSVG